MKCHQFDNKHHGLALPSSVDALVLEVIHLRLSLVCWQNKQCAENEQCVASMVNGEAMAKCKGDYIIHFILQSVANVKVICCTVLYCCENLLNAHYIPFQLHAPLLCARCSVSLDSKRTPMIVIHAAVLTLVRWAVASYISALKRWCIRLTNERLTSWNAMPFSIG